MSRTLAEIAEVRRAGIAFDLDEHTVGISAVGAAFAAPAGQTYALSIPVPSQRFAAKRDALERLLRAAIEEIESVLDG